MFGTEYLIVYELNEDKYDNYDKNEIYGCGLITSIDGGDFFIYDVVESKYILMKKKDIINPERRLKFLIEDYEDIIYKNLYHFFKGQIDRALDNKNIDDFNKYSKHYNELKLEGCVLWD